MNSELIIKEVMDYIVDYIEKPSEAFGGHAVCPFAKKFRLAGEIYFIVCDFSLSEEIDPKILALIDDFLAQSNYKSLFVIHPNKELDQEALVGFCERLQILVKPRGLLLFRGHPKDPFKIGNEYTRREPYPGFQLLHESLILENRAKLKPEYFKNWSPEALNEVFSG